MAEVSSLCFLLSGNDTMSSKSKGKSNQKKIEKFKKAHPEGRKAYAKAKKLAKVKSK